MDYDVKDIKLADQGKLKIEWAEATLAGAPDDAVEARAWHADFEKYAASQTLLLRRGIFSPQ